MAFPGTYNFNYYRGDTYEFSVFPKDSSGGVFTLNDYETARFTISEKRGTAGADLALEGTIANITIAKDAVTCVIPPDVGATMEQSKTYVYDVQVGSSSSPYDYVYTLLTGQISVTDDVTQLGAAPSAPSAPLSFSISDITSNSVTITWVAPAGNNPVTGYYVGKSTTPLDPLSYQPPTATLPSSDLTYTFTGLTPETLYGFAVQAYNNGGISDPAGNTATTLAE